MLVYQAKALVNEWLDRQTQRREIFVIFMQFPLSIAA